MQVIGPEKYCKSALKGILTIRSFESNFYEFVSVSNMPIYAYVCLCMPMYANVQVLEDTETWTRENLNNNNNNKKFF